MKKYLLYILTAVFMTQIGVMDANAQKKNTEQEERLCRFTTSISL